MPAPGNDSIGLLDDDERILPVQLDAINAIQPYPIRKTARFACSKICFANRFAHLGVGCSSRTDIIMRFIAEKVPVTVNREPDILGG